MGSFNMVLKRFELGLFRSSKKLKSRRKVMMDFGAQRPNSPLFVQKLCYTVCKMYGKFLLIYSAIKKLYRIMKKLKFLKKQWVVAFIHTIPFKNGEL